MYVALSDSTATAQGLFVPSWVLWGFVVALGLTFGLMAFVSLVAVTFTGLADGWQGGARPWEEIGKTFKVFIIYGLPMGLVISYLWSIDHQVIGVIAGLIIFGLVWWITVLVTKLRRA